MHDQTLRWAEIVDAIRGCQKCAAIPGKYNVCHEHNRMLDAAVGPCNDPACPACRPRAAEEADDGAGEAEMATYRRLSDGDDGDPDWCRWCGHSVDMHRYDMGTPAMVPCTGCAGRTCRRTS